MPMPPAVRYYVPREEADDGIHDLEEEEQFCPLPLSPPYSPARPSPPPASPTLLPTSPPSDDHADHTTDSLITLASTVDVAADDDFYFDFDFDDDDDDDMDEEHAEYLAECALKHYNGDAANEAKYELVAATATASSSMDCRGAFHFHVSFFARAAVAGAAEAAPRFFLAELRHRIAMLHTCVVSLGNDEEMQMDPQPYCSFDDEPFDVIIKHPKGLNK